MYCFCQYILIKNKEVIKKGTKKKSKKEEIKSNGIEREEEAKKEHFQQGNTTLLTFPTQHSFVQRATRVDKD